ncbi:MAG: hypothetical protein NTY37_02170 [Methanothrix sp.]|nr:hypothetical protein [Methanothrix sp.]
MGGTGETGSWFARYFKEKGFDVVVKAGRCNEGALQDLRLLAPAPLRITGGIDLPLPCVMLLWD